MNYGRVAQNVRAAKQRYPERYCKEPNCLRKVTHLVSHSDSNGAWNTHEPNWDCEGGRCPRHQRKSEHALGTEKHYKAKPKEFYHD